VSCALPLWSCLFLTSFFLFSYHSLLSYNNLCYNVNYGAWVAASSSDYSSVTACANCQNFCLNNGTASCVSSTLTCNCLPDYIGNFCEFDTNLCRSSPCQNGGTCNNGINSFTCDCTGTLYTGTLCTFPDPTNTACDPGYAKVGGSGNCKACSEGYFSLGTACVPCQAGSFSATPAATSASACQPCPAGQFSSTAASNSCQPCGAHQCAVLGSMVSSASSPVPVPFSSQSLDSSGEVVGPALPDISGYIFLGVFVGFVIITGLVALCVKKCLQRPIAAAAVMLKTPLSVVEVLGSNGRLVERPSYARGIVGLWVAAGVLIVTLYQIDVFATQGRGYETAVQPGTIYTSGLSTSDTNATASLSLVLFQTAVTCNTSLFTLNLTAQNSLSADSTTIAPHSCVVDAAIPSLNLSYIFPASLSFTSASAIVFTSTSSDQSPLFSHGVYYQLNLSSYDELTIMMSELLTNDPVGKLTGDVTVELSTIPTEYIYDIYTVSTGYLYTHFSSAAAALDLATSPTLTVSFLLPVPGYFYQIKNYQAISGLVFVTGLLALAAGVITGGSLFANVFTYLQFRIKGKPHMTEPKEKPDLPTRSGSSIAMF